MPMQIESDTLKEWLGQDDPFIKLAQVHGKVVRAKEGRQTQRIEIGSEAYYAKFHGGIGWREVFKNLLQLRLPVTGAENEWQAIRRLRTLGMDTLNAVAFGKRGLNPARRQSFVVTEELRDTLSLAIFAEPWPTKPPGFALRRALIRQVAEMTRTLHGAGINHRDLYICHFLLDISPGLNQIDPKALRLFLVDLHRAQIRRKVPERWLVKDIGSLYFSAMDIGLTPRDVFFFLKIYFRQPLRQILVERKALLRAVEKRAVRLYLRDFGRDPELIL